MVFLFALIATACSFSSVGPVCDDAELELSAAFKAVSDYAD